MDDKEFAILIDAYRKGEPIPLVSDEIRSVLQELLVAPTEKPAQTELDRVKKLIETERIWWQSQPSYDSLSQIEDDIKAGILVKVESDENLRLIMRLQNQVVDGYMPYLHRDTAVMLKEVGKVWREVSRSYGIDESVRLAVTNLLVTSEYRDRMIKLGKLAVQGSSHSKGQSFDLDGCGYYKGDSSINPRQTNDYDSLYNKDVHIALRAVLDRMQKEELLNYIAEFPNSKNQSFHVTRNPNNIVN